MAWRWRMRCIPSSGHIGNSGQEQRQRNLPTHPTLYQGATCCLAPHAAARKTATRELSGMPHPPAARAAVALEAGSFSPLPSSRHRSFFHIKVMRPPHRSWSCRWRGEESKESKIAHADKKAKMAHTRASTLVLFGAHRNPARFPLAPTLYCHRPTARRPRSHCAADDPAGSCPTCTPVPSLHTPCVSQHEHRRGRHADRATQGGDARDAAVSGRSPQKGDGGRRRRLGPGQGQGAAGRGLLGHCRLVCHSHVLAETQARVAFECFYLQDTALCRAFPENGLNAFRDGKSIAVQSFKARDQMCYPLAFLGDVQS